MFKTPDWEDDVPRSHVELSKKNKIKKDRATSKLTVINNNKLNGQAKTKTDKSINKLNGPLQAKTKTDKSINKLNGPLQAKTKTDKSINKLNGPLQAKTKTDKSINNLKKISNKQKKRNNAISFSNDKTNLNGKVEKLSNINKNSNNTHEKKLNQMKNNKKYNYVTHPVKMKHIDNEQINNNGGTKKADKRKITESDDTDDDRIEEKNFDFDKIDEVMLNAKKKKLCKAFKNDDREDLLFSEVQTTLSHKNEKFKFDKFGSQSSRNSVQTSGNKLRQRMLEILNAAKFRFLNEKLYTSSGSDAQQLFQSDPAAFQTYHQGYQQQLKKWPVKPLDVIVKKILRMSKSHIIADMGCGEAALSKRVPHTVRSFDLIATVPGVEACDMAHTPLLSASVDVAVYCLALMGTDLTQYLVEANRVLKIGGHLLIAEVESRFDDVDAFTGDIKKLGFKLKKIDNSHKVFFFFDFVKVQPPPSKKSKLPALSLKPCLYKKR